MFGWLGFAVVAAACEQWGTLWAPTNGVAQSSLPRHMCEDLVAYSQLSVMTGGEEFCIAGTPRGGLRHACSPVCRFSPVPSPFRTQPGSTPVFSGSVKENSNLGYLGVVFNSSLLSLCLTL